VVLRLQFHQASVGWFCKEFEMAITLNGTTGITTPTYNGTPSAEYIVPVTAFKNRIINGAMVIAQRGTSAITADTSSQFPVDRFVCNGSTSGKFTAQQNAASVTPPSGFINYLGTTSSSAYSVPTGEAYSINHIIEGLNVTDLGWGAAGAASVTLSFWVRSSLTGTFGGVIKNNASNRSYPFSFTISSANTWEFETITISGDTTGTWLTTNGSGIVIIWSLGAGSSLLGTAGSWSASNLYGATGQTNVVGTNGATFYITGVQLEKGSTATSFDYRPYGTELSLCQRYYYRTSPGTQIANGLVNTTTAALGLLQFEVPLRTAPSALEQSGTAGNYRVRTSGGVLTTCSSVPTFSSASIDTAFFIFTVASGLTAGQACMAEAVNTSGWLAWSAEL
jgi:hypothetical protein